MSAAKPRRQRLKPRFLSLEGGEGAGKSTLSLGLRDRLGEIGVRTLLTREPGGSAKAERIRTALLSGEVARHGSFAEALMFYAARIDHVEQVIAPALLRGEWVISDRFADSTRAYQGALGRLDPKLLAALERVALQGFRPDLTLIIDVPVEVGLARATARRGPEALDRFEREGRGFHTRLREAYLEIAEREPERCIVIDGELPPSDVLDLAWTAVETRLLGQDAAAEA